MRPLGNSFGVWAKLKQSLWGDDGARVSFNAQGSSNQLAVPLGTPPNKKYKALEVKTLSVIMLKGNAEKYISVHWHKLSV